MKDDDDFLNIFQDPLMTIIALVLLSTLWMVLPSEGESSTGSDQHKSNKNKTEIDKLTKEMTRVELNIIRSETEILKYNRELGELDNQLNEAKKRELALKQHKPLYDKAGRLKKRIEKKQLEKNRNEVEMLALQDRQKENRRIKDINGEIDRERERLNIKEKDMTKLTQKLEQSGKQRLNNNELKNELQELATKKLKIEQMITDKENKLNRMKTQGRGHSEYPIISGKKPFQFGLANKKIFLANDADDIRKNYSIDKEHKWRKGIKVLYAKLSLKEYVVGESIKEIESPDSSFQKVLKKRDPEKEFIVFSLLADSFEVFRKARSIASGYGFSTDWAPSGKIETVCIKPRKMCPKMTEFRATGP